VVSVTSASSVDGGRCHHEVARAIFAGILSPAAVGGSMLHHTGSHEKSEGQRVPDISHILLFS